MTCQYDKTILSGDFNLTVENNDLENFMNTFDLECLMKKPTCFQSSSPRCIDLILTNKKELFKNNDVFEVGISDHHSFIVTALKSQLLKRNAKTKLYRDYSSFSLESSKKTLKIASKITLLQNTPILKMFSWKFSINMHLPKQDIKIQ